MYYFDPFKCTENFLWPCILFTYSPWMLENNIFCFYWVECSVDVRSSWLIVLFKSCIFLLIFWLVVPHIIESEVLKSSTTLVFPFYFPVWVACSWVFPLVLWKAYIKFKKNFFLLVFIYPFNHLNFLILKFSCWRIVDVQYKLWCMM